MACTSLLLFRKAFLIVFFILFYSIAFAQIQQKRTFEISTEKLDSVNREIINVTEDSFMVSLKPHGDFGLKKAMMFINDKNGQNITSQLEKMMFTITDFNSIRLELQLGKKTYEVEPPKKMMVLAYTKNGQNETDTVTYESYFDYLKENKIDTLNSASPVIVPLSNTVPVISDSITTYNVVFINAIDVEGRSLRNSNLIIGALIKTLAGARPEDELIDLFVKLNYGKQKRFFSLLGADVGIGSAKDSTDSTGLFRINEASANFNWALYRNLPYKTMTIKKIKQKVKAEVDAAKNDTSRDPFLVEARARDKYFKLNDSLKKLNVAYVDSNLRRTAFIGGGLKIFHSTPYVGVHFGSMEINGPLFGSYIFAGYYYSPYLKPIIKTSDSLRSFRSNIYIEAGINAFGSRVPNVLKTVKFKFGMMHPIKSNGGNDPDTEGPAVKDVISRLAIEVPLGTVFRF